MHKRIKYSRNQLRQSRFSSIRKNFIIKRKITTTKGTVISLMIEIATYFLDEMNFTKDEL